MDIRIATRKSALALWQARHVATRLEALPGVASTTLVPLSTRGDEILDKSLQKIGGKGLFIKELEVAMRDGRADLAVHSMKDVPATLPQGFCIAAVLARASAADALVSRDALGLDELPDGAVIGSSSLRRQAQLLRARPDLDIRPLRGNVNTRLARLDDGDFDAIVLAAAGLERLGFEERISERFRPDTMLPAAAQGVLGLECLSSRDELIALLGQLHDDRASCTTSAERAIARVLQASCQAPVAAYATLDGDDLQLAALVASPDGRELLEDNIGGVARDAEALGIALGERLLRRGARKLLDAIEAGNA